MNMKNPEYALEQAVAGTFADMAFIDVIRTAEAGYDMMYGQILFIAFSGELHGSLVLYLPLKLKQMIASNIHGRVFSSLKPYEIDDCLLELINVLAGNFLGYYLGMAARYTLTLPEAVFDEKELPAGDRFSKYFFNAEGEPFLVAVCLKAKGV